MVVGRHVNRYGGCHRFASLRLSPELGCVYRRVLDVLLGLIFVYCLISLGWSLTYHMDPYGNGPNHSCVEMTDEVSEVLAAFHIPHKKVTGMTSYNDEWGMWECHEWIMIVTPYGEIPFESTTLTPVFFRKEYYNYEKVIEEG